MDNILDLRIKNMGVIIGQRSTDYIAGTLPYENRNPSGDWTPYLPTTEKQYFDGGDSMACVSFSANNSVEIQTKFLSGNETNYSDRFLAKMSGTTQQGNYLYIVADTIRKCGLVAEEDWPALPVFTWGTYYSDIPDWIKTKALKWLDNWEVKYEFLSDLSKESLMNHLHHAPLQVVIPGHAVVLILNNQDVVEYFDTYSPFIKQSNGSFMQALKIVLYKKTSSNSSMDRFVRVDKDVWLVRNGKRSLFFNALAFELMSGKWDKIETITQAQLDTIPDTGKVLAGIDQQ
jgi:hypothetical protein